MGLHEAVDRPNLMVKIPATLPGLAAVEDVIATGHSINVTLIFSLQRYAAVAESYIRGLERFAAKGGDLSKVASVASFFVSRIDTEADRRISERRRPSRARHGQLRSPTPAGLRALPPDVHRSALGGARGGARPRSACSGLQRRREPRFPRRLYVEELIGPETVNTMPLATIEAFADHGNRAPRLTDDLTRPTRCSTSWPRRASTTTT